MGFVRGLETFSQMFSQDEYSGNWSLLSGAANISNDKPDKPYRSVMIDTSRHYLKKETVLETIDSLMYAKMSILHWHMVDEDSFPVRFPSHPEIVIKGAFSIEQIYTEEDVKAFVEYAALRGVTIVP